jgi:trk system potassium uptake protein TrkH
MIPIGFIVLILVGTVLLALPFTHNSGESVSILDALFLSTSATCVTGLTTVNVAESLNRLGHTTLLVLFQVGGLGIMTAGTFFLLLTGNRLSLAHETSIVGTFGKLRSARPLDVLIYACAFVLIAEFAGFVAMFSVLTQHGPEQAIEESAWQAAFHAVSAFCNAGISVFPEGLARWKDQPLLLGIVNLLVIAGGIGLLTLVNLRFYYWWRRDTRRRGQLGVQTKVAVLLTVVLLLAGAVLTLLLEWNRTLGGGSWGERLSWAFFHSTMTRSAGFSVVDTGQMHPATLFISMALMFIGGAPGSMAGGIKIITAAVLVMAAWTALRRQQEVNLFRRRVPRDQTGAAVMLALMAAGCVFVAMTLLFISESGRPAAQTELHQLALAFEAVSAFGTVGASTGVTPLLTPAGKLIIIAFMFIGRVGPLMLAIHLCRPAAPWHARHPAESVSLG